MRHLSIDMNELIKTIKHLSEIHPLENFEWSIPENCPIKIPESICGGYEKNIFLKENFHAAIANDLTLKNHYWAIQEWGGIGSFKRNEKNDSRIRGFLNELKKEKLTKSSFDCISSLSKVASFIEPEKYVIYDSRVIYSLNWLIFNHSSERLLFPQPIGRSKDLAKYDMQTIFRLSKKSFGYISTKDAYHKYCMLINDLSPKIFNSSSKPYNLEMLLFMIAPSWIVGDIEKTVALEIKPVP